MSAVICLYSAWGSFGMECSSSSCNRNWNVKNIMAALSNTLWRVYYTSQMIILVCRFECEWTVYRFKFYEYHNLNQYFFPPPVRRLLYKYWRWHYSSFLLWFCRYQRRYDHLGGRRKCDEVRAVPVMTCISQVLLMCVSFSSKHSRVVPAIVLSL